MAPLITREAWQQALEARCGREAYIRLQQAKVAIIGLGGLGSNIAILLARMGVGKLHLLDFDQVELSNLHRQHYALAQVGLLKTEALTAQLRELNPWLELVVDNVKVKEDNYQELLGQDEYYCEAVDQASTKAWLINALLTTWPERYVVAASGMAGAGSTNLLQARRISEHFYLCGDGCSDCQQESLVASRVALCAAQQAHLIYRLILGLE